MELINKNFLMNCGYSKTQAQNLIRTAKSQLAQQFPYYRNKKVGLVPKQSVEQIIGCELNLENVIIESIKSGAVRKEVQNDSNQK